MRRDIPLCIDLLEHKDRNYCLIIGASDLTLEEAQKIINAAKYTARTARHNTRQAGIPIPATPYLTQAVDTKMRQVKLDLQMGFALKKKEIAPNFAEPKKVISSPRITLQKIMELVGEEYMIRPDILQGKEGRNKYAVPRQLVWYLCRMHTDFSYPEIGEMFARHHTSIIYGAQQTEIRMKTMYFKSIVDNLEAQLRHWIDDSSAVHNNIDT